MKYRAVIFDLDGTLLDTVADIAHAANAALQQHGYPPHPAAAYKRFAGSGVEALLTRALPAGARERMDDAAFNELVHTMQAVYHRSAEAKTCPYPGITQLLAHLAEAGLVLGVLSNKPHDATVLVVKHFFPSCPFADVRGAREDVPLKPAPDGALAMARPFGCAPGDICYVGDSDVDMRTARGAGMFAAGVTWGFRTADELLESGADTLFDTAMELENFLLDR